METKIQQFLDQIDTSTIADDRKRELSKVVDYITQNSTKVNSSLHFICTHNSRRSQFCQVWATVLAHYFNQPINAFSGGTEVTEVPENVVDSLSRSGFTVKRQEDVVLVDYSNNNQPIKLWSKKFDDSANPTENFMAVMVCDHAAENCPFVPGADQRIALSFQDPKNADGTDQVENAYDRCSKEVATEIYWIFKQLS